MVGQLVVGSLASCAPVAYRRFGRVANPPQDSILPHINLPHKSSF